MKKLLLLFTLALTSQHVRGNDVPPLDLFAMLGVAPDCNTEAVEEALEMRKQSNPSLAQLIGNDFDRPGYHFAMDRIACLLSDEISRQTYHKLWSDMNTNDIPMENPFNEDEFSLTELGTIAVRGKLARIEEYVALYRFRHETVDPRPYSCSPPIAIPPPSPVSGRKSAASVGGRPLSRSARFSAEW